MRLVRTLSEGRWVVVRRRADAARVYKSGSNHCYEVWRQQDGGLVPWVVTAHEAHAPGVRGRPGPHSKLLLLRLHKGDLVAIERGAGREICRVQSFNIDLGVSLAPHAEGGAAP